MTIMTTTFIPCGAKMPFIAMIAGAIFGGSAATWVATSAYFIGIAAIIISGIMLKKTKMFAGDPAPFVMELPAYHCAHRGQRAALHCGSAAGPSSRRPVPSSLLSTIVRLVHHLLRLWWTALRHAVEDRDRLLHPGCHRQRHRLDLQAPLGWGNWQAAVASITGLVAKENIVGTLGYPVSVAASSEAYTAIAALSHARSSLLLPGLQPAVRTLLRSHRRHQARDEQRQVDWFAIGYPVRLHRRSWPSSASCSSYRHAACPEWRARGPPHFF